MTRRSKRKSLVAIRCSARQQARQQQDAEIYGSDYGILPSGACFRVWRVSVGVGACLALVRALRVVISRSSHI